MASTKTRLPTLKSSSMTAGEWNAYSSQPDHWKQAAWTRLSLTTFGTNG